MEVGRGSAGSNNDFHDRRRKTKKKLLGSLPLGVFLSFNDRGVHPQCPNASNSYHKCGRHCFEKIPPGNLDWKRERGKKFEKEGVDPNCPNASNPYHKCAEYCFENLQDQPAMKPKEEKKAGLISDRLVKSECKFASNPYHVCAKHCLESVPTSNQPEQTMRLKSSREVKKATRKKERTTGSPPPCKQKSIPYHECTEICLQSAPNRIFAEPEKPNGDSVKSDKISAHLNRSASVPFHTVTANCLEDTLEKEHPKRAIKPKEESDIIATVKSRANLEGKSNNSQENTVQNVPDRKINEGENPGGVSITTDNTSEHRKPKHLSSPHQKMTEYCLEDTAEKELLEGVVKLKDETEMVRSLSERERREEDMKPKGVNVSFTAQFGDNYWRKNASSPYYVRAEDSFRNLPVKSQSGEGFMKSKEDKVVVPLERGLSSRCLNASNPYHVCAEYGFEDFPRGRVTMTAREQKKIFSSLPRMNSECKNASNPYHNCAEFCNVNALERDQPGKERVVNPDCQFASNPYHVCAEYCFQNISETEKRRQDVKLKGLKELKNLVSNKKITSGQPQCNFASNPYHKCAEYCLNGNMPDNYSTRRYVDPSHKHASKKNEEAEVTFKEKKRDSLKDGMKRSSAESIHVEASNPINDRFDLRVVTKDLQSAKVVETKSLKEAADVQLIDSSDILHEWAKYCSQKGNVEGEDDASENLKVQTSGRFACFLPISLLFFLGFLLSAAYWIQMIHSFVMSPEKVEGDEGMKAEGDGDPECRNVSDPYDICTDGCFRGSGE